MGVLNISGQNILDIAEIVPKSSTGIAHPAFEEKLRIDGIYPNNKVLVSDPNYAGIHDTINVKNKILINEEPTKDIARKGRRPLNNLVWETVTRKGKYNITRAANHAITVNGQEIIPANRDVSVIYVLMCAGGGRGGGAKGSWFSAYSGGGGGSGAYALMKLDFLHTPGEGINQSFTVEAWTLDQNGGNIKIKSPVQSSFDYKVEAGGWGGDGAGGGGGAGVAGTFQTGAPSDINIIKVIASGNGKPGRPTRPKDYGNNSNMPKTTAVLNNPENANIILPGGNSGQPGGQNEAGPGAGGYFGAGGNGGDYYGDGRLGGKGGVGAGSGGADAKWNWNSGHQDGGDATIKIYY